MAAESQYTKACSACKKSLPLSMFGLSKGYRDGRRSQCNPCRSARGVTRYKSDPSVRERARASQRRRPRVSAPAGPSRWRHLRTKYGISEEQYVALLDSQLGLCAICETDQPGGRRGVLCVDHCHTTGRVRGLLCSKCNTGLGKLGDNEAGLLAALSYVRRTAGGAA